MESEDRSSTASTVSGIYRNILQSPAPICMFYFAHPFGVSSPTGGVVSAADREQQSATVVAPPHLVRRLVQPPLAGRRQQSHLTSYIPWPEDTWRRDDSVLPTLVRALATQMGHNVPDLEALIRNIRHAWNTPSCRSFLQSRAARYEQFISVSATVSTNSSASSSYYNDGQLRQQHNRQTMGAGNYCNLAVPGLFRRRYSMPEIIMRKHSLAQPKSFDENANSSAPTTQNASPTPPIRPTRSSLESNYHHHHHNSHHRLQHQQYTIHPNGTSSASGSETNISSRLTDTSMRRQLLRRIWSKEFRQQDTRSGSWSPPLRRSQRRLHVEPPDKCNECTKLEQQYDHSGAIESLQKRVRLSSSTQSMDETTTTPLSPCHLVATHIDDSTTPISSSTTNRVTSSSDRPVVTTSTSCGPLEISSGLGEREVVRKNVFVYINSRDTSSADDNVGADDGSRSEPESTLARDEPIRADNAVGDNDIDADCCWPTSTDSGNGFTPSNTAAETQSVSRIDENENEPLDNEESNANRTIPDNIGDEANGNAVTVEPSVVERPPNFSSAKVKAVDQYISDLLIDSLNNVIRMSSTAKAFRIDDQRSKINDNDVVDMHTNEDNSTIDLNDNNINHSRILTINEVEPPPPPPPFEEHRAFNEKYSETSTMAIGVAHRESCSAERHIYFPSYSVESKDNLSIFSTQFSEDDDFFDSPDGGQIIPVQTGSTYPSAEYHRPVVIPRLVHRTESMEAQPASTSPREIQPDNDGGGAGDSDDSLVDSLDDPSSPRGDQPNETEDIPSANDPEPISSAEPVQYEKSQTFFIPIVDANETINERIDVASAMPIQLRERLMKRLQTLGSKKLQVHTKKQKKLDKLIKRNRSDTSEPIQNPNKMAATTSKSTSAQTDATANKSVASQFKAGKRNKFLRAEIGLLESYTIDARGNLQFKPPPQPPSKEANNNINASSTTTTTSTSTSVKRSSTMGTSAATTTTKKSQASSRKGDVITIKRSQTKKSTVNSTQRRKEVIKDVQQMTLYQTQSDLITPDTDCGPRRVYQKTEIHDGEKRIEILEIVECIDSSGVSSNSSCSPEEGDLLHSYRTRLTAAAAALMRKSSRIPVPVYKVAAQKSAAKGVAASRDNSPGRIFVKNIQQLSAAGSGNVSGAKNNTMVDQMIADLLIEALNHPRELGIEFVKSPKDFSRHPSGTPGSSGGGGCSLKRSPMSRRSNSGSGGGGGSSSGSRRSASGAKYQQMFEVIPEEKGSMSSNEDVGGRTKTSTMVPSTSITTSGSNATQIVAVNEVRPPVSRIARGKEAIENDISAEPDAWIGFFRQHDDTEDDTGRTIPGTASPLRDSAVLPTATAVATSIDNSVVVGTVTPVSSADVLVSSSGSENILSVIDRTLLPSSTSTVVQVPSTSSSFSDLLSYPISTINCAQCKIIEHELKQHVEFAASTDSTTKAKSNPKLAIQSPHTPLGPDRTRHVNDNVWQVDVSENQIPAMLSIHPPLSPIESVQESSSTNKSSSDIDSTSFIILRDDVDTSKELLLATANLSITDQSIGTIAPTTALSSDVLIFANATTSPSMSETTDRNSAPIMSSAPTSTALTTTITPAESTNSKERCNDCCFCNPNLHRRGGALSAESCSYCNQQRSPQPATLASDPKTPLSPPPTQKTQETRSTNTIHCYETLSKTDHTHVRTRSKDSDTVSLKCTRTASKVRRFIPEDTLNGNTFEDATIKPTNCASEKKQSHWTKNSSSYDANVTQKPPKMPMTTTTTTTIQPPTKNVGRSLLADTVKTTKTYRSGHVRLPSPFAKGVASSSQSYDSASSSSQCSSASSSPSSPSKKCPVLPVSRWQNQTTMTSSNHRSGHAAKPRASRYQNFYGNNRIVADKDVATVNGVAKDVAQVAASVAAKADLATTINQSSGWSLTLAGTYRDDMAPDVEMRLSFPKKSPNDDANTENSPHCRQHAKFGNTCMPPHNQHLNNNYDDPSRNGGYQRQPSDVSNDNYQHSGRTTMRPTLPIPAHLNPKRTLSKSIPARQQNATNINTTTVRHNYTLPEVNTFDREVARQTARKTIKRSEYSVAVASATKTISNFSHGKRAMSFQTLNANAYRIDNRDRNQHYHHHHHHHRDHSVDLGHISSRRMSLDSPAPPSDLGMALSVLGNHIAPEQKPRVPTMSERDLTRKPNSCFTRNRAFFS